MNANKVKVCILRTAGTNCDIETRRAFSELGMHAEILHFNQLLKTETLLNYHVLVFPGGFSYGDYVRAGAIWAKWITAKLAKPLKQFIEEKRLVLGICNGFQILVETGLLPGFRGVSEHPEAALAPNIPLGYNCRWVYLRNESNGNCAFTLGVPKGRVLRLPVAHSEGRFIFPQEKQEKLLEKLEANNQLVLRYCRENGEPANGQYPHNPNGAFYDIAGICNPEGTVFGLMPHPERAFFGWQLPDWTGMRKLPIYGDGKVFFESVVKYWAKTGLE